jgi:hypothetical protein
MNTDLDEKQKFSLFHGISTTGRRNIQNRFLPEEEAK